MQADAQKYALRGVSANKTDVHNAIQNLDKGLYSMAFCKILPDFVQEMPIIAISCTPIQQELRQALPICIGAKQATYRSGKVLFKTQL